MGLHTRDVEEIAHHILQLPDIIECERQVLTLLRIQIAKYAIQYVGCEKIDRRPRSAQFMRNMRKKLFLQACTLPLGLFEYDRDFLPLSHVLHDDREALNLAHVV